MNLLDPVPSPTTMEPVRREIMFSLLAAAGALESRLEAALAEVDLSMPKLCLLSQIMEAGEPPALSDLASGLRCVRSNVTQLVDRLQAEGLVRRIDDPTDRRIVRAELTPLGVERQAKGQQVLDRIQAEFSARLRPEDQGALERLLASLG